MLIKKVLKHWLIHFFIAWLVLNIFYTADHFYQYSIWGDILRYPNGKPVTILQFLIDHNLHSSDFLYLIPFILFVELDYHYILRKKGLVAFMLCSIIVGIVSAIILIFIHSIAVPNKFPVNYLEPSLWLILYTFVYGLLREFFRQWLHHIKVQLNRSEGELHALKQQLNPHFLFNTLNYLYGTALHENAARTAAGIDLMADMMRYTLSGMQQKFVPLNQEIQFIENYLKLQKLRLPLDDEHLLEAEITTDGKPCTIAPMLLIPFIENACKYGVSTDHSSYIHIKIGKTGGMLNMQISNSITPGTSEVKGTNSGLVIARKQLELLYPEKHSLKIETDENNYHVQLTLQLQ